MTIAYTIPLPPITKKNSQQILTNKKSGKSFVAPSKAYSEYERAAIWRIQPKLRKPIATRVNVKMVYYMPTRRRVDLVNLQEATLDILVKAGVLADDNSGVVATMDGSRVLYDKERPRTEIYISPLED